MLTQDEFRDLVAEGGSLIIDGALATELEARGHDLNHPLWSAKVLKDEPDSIKQVHLDYYLAGADISITATYQASIQGLRDFLGMDEHQSCDIIKRSVELAQQAREEAHVRGVSRERRLLIAGSVGPYGAFLADGSEYHGNYERTSAEFRAFHKPRIQALVEADVDLLAIETIPKYEEIEALLDLLRDEFPTGVAWLSCTLMDPQHLSDGIHIEEVLKLVNLHRDRVVAVGVNCVPADIAFEALQNMKRHSVMPLLCYPNSGETWDAKTKTWSGVKPDATDAACQILAWQAAGATLIGGCCRTGPSYIRKIARTLQSTESFSMTAM